jgi:hypothetical protein
MPKRSSLKNEGRARQERSTATTRDVEGEVSRGNPNDNAHQTLGRMARTGVAPASGGKQIGIFRRGPLAARVPAHHVDVE